MKRMAPAIGLFFLAPFISEYPLGDLPLTKLGYLLILAPLYGGGALLIREVVRRLSKGWPTILMLAFAYAVLEEAFTTQTLFNPNYLKLKPAPARPSIYSGARHRRMVDNLCPDAAHGLEHLNLNRTDRSVRACSRNEAMAGLARLDRGRNPFRAGGGCVNAV